MTTTLVIDWIRVFQFCFIVIVALGLYCYGYARGAKDTEQRWSDAVGRSKDN